MFIFEVFDGFDLLFAMAGTFGLLFISVKIGLMKNWLDPLGPGLFQSILTLVLLGQGYIPVGHTVMFCLMLLLVAKLRPSQHIELPSETYFWERSLGALLVLSVIANIFLVSQKGLVVLQEDVGNSRLNFYQGWGLFERLNAATVILFGVRWSKRLLAGRGRELSSIFLLLWVIYLGLTLGSKAGLVTILAYIGAVLCFERRTVSISSFLPLVALSLLSITVMFYIFFGNDFLVQTVVRFVSFADGPYYYYGLPYSFRVPLSYPFDQLATVFRLQAGLSQLSLGTLINYWSLGYYNELVGPNPQIFVESQAMAGIWYPFYYLGIGLTISACLRLCRSPYSLALAASFYVAILADEPYAFSNIFNIVVTTIIIAGVGLVFDLARRSEGMFHA